MLGPFNVYLLHEKCFLKDPPGMARLSFRCGMYDDIIVRKYVSR